MKCWNQQKLPVALIRPDKIGSIPTTSFGIKRYLCHGTKTRQSRPVVFRICDLKRNQRFSWRGFPDLNSTYKFYYLISKIVAVRVDQKFCCSWNESIRSNCTPTRSHSVSTFWSQMERKYYTAWVNKLELCLILQLLLLLNNLTSDFFVWNDDLCQNKHLQVQNIYAAFCGFCICPPKTIQALGPRTPHL